MSNSQYLLTVGEKLELSPVLSGIQSAVSDSIHSQSHLWQNLVQVYTEVPDREPRLAYVEETYQLTRTDLPSLILANLIREMRKGKNGTVTVGLQDDDELDTQKNEEIRRLQELNFNNPTGELKILQSVAVSDNPIIYLWDPCFDVIYFCKAAQPDDPEFPLELDKFVLSHEKDLPGKILAISRRFTKYAEAEGLDNSEVSLRSTFIPTGPSIDQIHPEGSIDVREPSGLVITGIEKLWTVEGLGNLKPNNTGGDWKIIIDSEINPELEDVEPTLESVILANNNVLYETSDRYDSRTASRVPRIKDILGSAILQLKM